MRVYIQLNSLYKLRALKLLLDQLDKFKIDIGTIQEIKSTGQGIFEKKRVMRVYMNSVPGFSVKGNYRQMIIEFKQVSPSRDETA